MIIPSAHIPANLAFSQRESAVHWSLLESNGYLKDRAELRRATGSDQAVLRAAAFQLLAEDAQPEDLALFQQGSADPDSTADAWAAFGLERLHPTRGQETLKELAMRGPEFGQYASLIAASLLARLGDPSAFGTIRSAMREFAERPPVVQRLLPFAQLGVEEVWPLYAQALTEPSAAVKEMVLAQLRELHSSRAIPVLQQFVASQPDADPWTGVAQSLLAELRQSMPSSIAGPASWPLLALALSAALSGSACQGGKSALVTSGATVANADIPAISTVISSNHSLPRGAPYSAWEHHEQQDLLQANDFGSTRGEWRRAASAGSPAVRAAACGLIARQPIEEDRATIEARLLDDDRTVRAWATLGAARLGRAQASAELRSLSTQRPGFGDLSPLIAAGALARLGDASAVETIQSAIKRDDDRTTAVRLLFDFARLPQVNIWPLYAVALNDRSPLVRDIALAQLEELQNRDSISTLEQSAADGPLDPDQRARARKLIITLQR